MNLRTDAKAIWQAGVDGVASETLVSRQVQCSAEGVVICGEQYFFDRIRRIEVVGAGKAGAGMAHGLLSALRTLPPHINLSGWLNVPEDCVCEAGPIRIHGARPAGMNEPTEEGVQGTAEILARVSQLEPEDLCIVLMSGGGSALMPSPVAAISLSDKLRTTQCLAVAGTPIQNLNLVRRELSRVKGGGLLNACSARSIVSLIVSDVIGDPLEAIASGPTVPTRPQPQRALDVLLEIDPDRERIPPGVYQHLEERIEHQARSEGDGLQVSLPGKVVRNHIIGSNAVALEACSKQAAELGYEVVSLGAENCGDAADFGVRIMRQLMDRRDSARNCDSSKKGASRVCVLAGGETTVELCSSPGKGGRNQETVLGALTRFPLEADWSGLALLSGGTDGEDGPTDAAGAVADLELVRRIRKEGISSETYLRSNNAYPFLESMGGLLKTGPTHTNVMDIVVGLLGID